MAKGTYVLAVDWNNDGDFSDSGEDITARTMNIEYTRGSDYASQLVGRGVAGVLNAVVNTRAGIIPRLILAEPCMAIWFPAGRLS